MGTITTINKWFSIHTREWDCRWHVGLDPVIDDEENSFQTHNKYASDEEDDNDDNGVVEN